MDINKRVRHFWIGSILTTLFFTFMPTFIYWSHMDSPNTTTDTIVYKQSPFQQTARVLPRIIGVQKETGQLMDELGRSRQFHGVNVVYKAYPWHPAVDAFNPVTSFTEEDAKILASLNLNFIRLAIHWAGAEPEKGKFNETYFRVMRSIVDSCEKHGIYVLLEFHQDVLAPQYCGHGVPSWLFADTLMKGWRAFPFPQLMHPFSDTDGEGVPSKESCDSITWYHSYLTPSVANAFGRLYRNDNGLLDQFENFWKQVAMHFKDKSNLIGYEIMNEPWPGDHWRNPFLLLPGISSQTTLYRLHDRVASAIRSVHPEAIIFFEGITWDIHNRAPTVPGGVEYANKSVLSYHHYSPPVIGTIEDTIRRRKNDAKRLGCGLFLTEFDMWWHEDSIERDAVKHTIDISETENQNWSGWSYKSFAQGINSTDGGLFDPYSGELRREMAEMVSRPYVMSIEGKIHSAQFDTLKQEFTVNATFFNKSPAVFPSMEIGVSQKAWFLNGFKVRIQPTGKASWNYHSGILQIRMQPGIENAFITIKQRE